MNAAYDYDLVVIGSGPAGEKGAAQAAYFGKKVTLVERSPYLGGAGINTGTVPSKTLRETALYFSGLRQRGLYGIDYSLKDKLTVSDFMYRKGIVVENQWSLIRRNLEKHNIEVMVGVASLKDAHTVQVHRPDGSEVNLTAGTVLIATGSSPFHPPEVPFDHQVIYDSDSILQISHIPKSMLIVGGGVIGSEYASIFTALGVQVTLVDSRNRLLPFVDHEIAERLQQQLENIGVKLGERGLILVNEKYQTSVPNIYAAGDVIGFPALASTSMEQARVAMVHAFNLRYKEQVSPILPLAVYTIPEISMVGLSEDDCQKKEIPGLVGRAYYENNARGQIIGDLSGLLKLVFSPSDKKLLGVHLIGEMASELVHLGAQVIAAGGGIDAFIHAVYNYPSLSDAYKYAAYDGLGKLNNGTHIYSS